jgi:hypothetical protein
MSRVRTGRPEPATIIASAALLVAIAAFAVAVGGGFAGAAPSKAMVKRVVVVRKGKVRRGEIAPGAVTAKSIARGAVTEGKIGNGAVGALKLAKASVSAEAIAADAVTSGAIAPGSVYGGALAAETVVTKPITDLDKVAFNNEITPSNIEMALCGPGEALLGSGFAFTEAGNLEVSWLQVLPYLNGEVKGVQGRIASNAGGVATAEVAAICLK